MNSSKPSCSGRWLNDLYPVCPLPNQYVAYLHSGYVHQMITNEHAFKRQTRWAGANVSTAKARQHGLGPRRAWGLVLGWHVPGGLELLRDGGPAEVDVVAVVGGREVPCTHDNRAVNVKVVIERGSFSWVRLAHHTHDAMHPHGRASYAPASQTKRHGLTAIGR